MRSIVQQSEFITKCPKIISRPFFYDSRVFLILTVFMFVRPLSESAHLAPPRSRSRVEHDNGTRCTCPSVKHIVSIPFPRKPHAARNGTSDPQPKTRTEFVLSGSSKQARRPGPCKYGGKQYYEIQGT
jgi:hypothetical protein